MAFDRQSSRVPTSVGNMRIKFQDVDGTPANMSSYFVLDVLDQNGNLLREISGELTSHLTQQEITQIITFLQTLRTRAEEEVLPVP